MQVRGNFNYLLISLLGFLAFIAIVTEYPEVGGWNLVTVAFELSLIVAVWSLVRDRFWFIAGIILIVLGAISIVIQVITENVYSEVFGITIVFLFYLMTTVIAFRELFNPGGVDSNKIVGSICVYLLVGLIWAILYYYQSLLNPDAFIGLEYDDLKEKMFSLIYYSYVTLSTLGYGDITPNSPIAQVLAVTESLFGQFYIAILVAIMVGTHISRYRNQWSNRNDNSSE